ncbi:MAG: alpha-amylase family glycosyl hydrolase [Thermoflexibacter sp.]|jgi:amylosucrase|nr:alpha-amylase family glycosyl hydrolase [Thermoflexibacter sp.]
MYNHYLYTHVNNILQNSDLDISNRDNEFYTRFLANLSTIHELYSALYEHHPNGKDAFLQVIHTIIHAYKNRPEVLRLKDREKAQSEYWFLSNQIAGMSLYVDRFCGKLVNLPEKLPYFQRLGVNFLHLMPIFQSPVGESDGGYAVSNFREVDERFGTLEDLHQLIKIMHEDNMHIMLDIVLNHTSHHHEWAIKAKQGDPYYQDFFYMFDDRTLPDQFDQTMPEIFPEAASGNFTYISDCNKWVMTVFHNYQWDLNYANPLVFNTMLDTIFFYANLGVDILRIDAPAFIWKQLGTTCQNLPQAHTILRLIKQCVQVATSGMALLGEAIVAPKEIIKYFGTEHFTAHECDVAYNATQMALQWDALATGDTRVMLAAQKDIVTKPYGTTWITYTRCHDDIGLGYEDSTIAEAGFQPYHHRKFLKDYYSGTYDSSPAKGALFSVNPKTQDARISGSLASLCGLEKAVENKSQEDIKLSIHKILMMQACSFFCGGIPMLFYGDELGYTNDYSYMNEEGKSYDNRWMHRPIINWEKNKRIDVRSSIEGQIFEGTRKLLEIRKKLPFVADLKNLTWLNPHNVHVAGYLRAYEDKRMYGIFNFSSQTAYLTWYAFKEHGLIPDKLFDHWQEKDYQVGYDHDYLILAPYQFCLLEVK